MDENALNETIEEMAKEITELKEELQEAKEKIEALKKAIDLVVYDCKHSLDDLLDEIA